MDDKIEKWWTSLIMINKITLFVDSEEFLKKSGPNYFDPSIKMF